MPMKECYLPEISSLGTPFYTIQQVSFNHVIFPILIHVTAYIPISLPETSLVLQFCHHSQLTWSNVGLCSYASLKKVLHVLL